ncbi:MAG: Abi family protein [Bacilli bacterium]
MATKQFKNLNEQLDILRSKGLIIENEEEAKDILFRENYFFISGYRHLFMRTSKERHFIEGTTFDELYSMFVFDRQIRNIIFKNILIIENNIKSIISYQLSKKYGFKEKDYLNIKNFTQDNLKNRQVSDVLNKMKRQIKINGRQHSATLHYISNYGYIPLWILVKVLSFGIVSEFYSILKSEDQYIISEIYELDSDTLQIYLALLSNYRNLCAHEDILYDRRTQRAIPDTVYHYKLNIDMTDDEYNYGKNDLFALIIIMRQMLTTEEFREFIFELGYEVDILDGKIEVIPINIILNQIGFPDNWRDITDIN